MQCSTLWMATRQSIARASVAPCLGSWSALSNGGQRGPCSRELVRHPASARFSCSQLCRRWAPNIHAHTQFNYKGRLQVPYSRTNTRAHSHCHTHTPTIVACAVAGHSTHTHTHTYAVAFAAAGHIIHSLISGCQCGCVGWLGTLPQPSRGRNGKTY